MICTRKVELNSEEYFFLLLTIYFKKRWLLLVWISLMIFVLLISARISLAEYWLVAILCLAQVALVGQYWLYAHAKANRIYLQPRFFKITLDQIVEQMEDGTSTTIKTERCIRKMRTGKCYLLFVAKNEYVYIPFSAFESEADREWFDREIVKRIEKKQN